MAHLDIRMAWHSCRAAADAECLLQVFFIPFCPQCDMRALAGIIIAHINMRQTWASCVMPSSPNIWAGSRIIHVPPL